MGTFAIVLSLALLMFLAYRGYSVLYLAPLLAAMAVMLSGDFFALMPYYTDIFMKALGNYLVLFFPVFLLGAMFGQLMADSGAASVIARWFMDKLGTNHAILTVILSCAALTYGGVSLFVVAFAIYPIAKSMFYMADIPKRLIPASIALGSFTFTMTALPGTPAIQNAIPIPYYGTDAFAAPFIGIIAALIMFSLGWWWINSRAKKARHNGEGYGDHGDHQEQYTAGQSPEPMSFISAIAPLVLVILLNAIFTMFVFPSFDFSRVNELFPNINLKSVTGLWAIIIALFVACVWLIIAQYKRWGNLQNTLNKGSLGSMLPVFNTASEVGYGAVIASLAGFLVIKEFILGVAPDNPLISQAIAMTTLAGITGSSSGGLSIALQALGTDYVQMAHAAGIDLEVMHRVALLAAGGFDTLPHSGAVITLLSICGLTHRQSYMNIAAVTIGVPLIATVAAIILGTLFGSF